LDSLTSIPKGFNPTVGGGLYLSSLTSIPEGFNPTVGGDLNLRSLTSIPEGFNPTVGGYLYLPSLTSIPEGFNPTVGGELYYNNRWHESTNKPGLISWQEGKYVLVDGIFCEVISNRKNVWKCKTVNQDKIFYVVSDGHGKYAHGDSIREAKEDLIYKISNRDLTEYEGLTEDNVLTFEEAIECYRVVTGACAFGTKDFVKNNITKPKKKYSVKEIIALTQGQYGSSVFQEFFKK